MHTHTGMHMHSWEQCFQTKRGRKYLQYGYERETDTILRYWNKSMTHLSGYCDRYD